MCSVRDFFCACTCALENIKCQSLKLACFHCSGAFVRLNAHKMDILFAYVRKK